MAGSDITVSDRVLITCPACGASEAADPAAFAAAPMIVCRECGGTWPVAGRRTKGRRHGGLASMEPAPTIEAERRPLVTFSEGSDKAWIAKMEGDRPAMEPERRRLPAVAAGMAAILVLAGFFGGREAAVAALPDLAGLYGAIGLPVNLDGFAIERVTAERLIVANGAQLTVRGTVRNLGGAERAVPPLVAVVHNAATVPSGSHGLVLPMMMLKAGSSAGFTFAIDALPENAAEVVVRFRRRGETVAAVAGAWEEGAPGAHD